MSESLSLELYSRLLRITKKKNNPESKELVGSLPFEAGRDPLKISEIFDRTISAYGWETELAQGQIFTSWDQFVGDDIAQNSQPISLDEQGLLVVECKSTAWATELRRMKSDLIGKLQGQIPNLTISDIRFNQPTSRSWKKGYRSIPGRGPRDTYG